LKLVDLTGTENQTQSQMVGFGDVGDERNVEETRADAGSVWKGPLPEGCRQCSMGAKLVLLVTGKCRSGCYYCPLSMAKKGRDVVYADEMRAINDDDILKEARAIGAMGSGITGGDPLLVLDRTLRYIRLLKSKLGSDHHIHLYTAQAPDKPSLGELSEAGLDEIRFHIGEDGWGSSETAHVEHLGSIKEALDLGIITGVEIPAIPGKGTDMLDLAHILERAGCNFLNLNELEFSEGNTEALVSRGFRMVDDVTSTAVGSRETALGVIENWDGKMTVHFCSGRFKDSVQLRERLKRRAENTARPYQLVTDDGTLLVGVIECGESDPEALWDDIREAFDIPEELGAVDKDTEGMIEVAPWVLEKISGELNEHCYLVERYPTADGLEVERTPLNGPCAGVDGRTGDWANDPSNHGADDRSNDGKDQAQ